MPENPAFFFYSRFFNFFFNFICREKTLIYICIAFEQRVQRAVSSAGSEHLVYTQRVGGSNPSPPT